MRVDDETKMLCNFVIERTPGQIRGLRPPVNAGTPSTASCCVYSLNQAAPDATTSSMLRRKEILQVADIAHSGCAAMKHIMRKTNEVACLFRNDCLNWLRRVEEPLPGGSSDLFGKCRGTAAAVERVIPVPERSPTAVVRSQDGSYCRFVGHVCRGLTFDLSGTQRAAKPAIGFPLDGRIRHHCAPAGYTTLKCSQTTGISCVGCRPMRRHSLPKYASWTRRQ